MRWRITRSIVSCHCGGDENGLEAATNPSMPSSPVPAGVVFDHPVIAPLERLRPVDDVATGRGQAVEQDDRGPLAVVVEGQLHRG
jgi:hypothetical protein